MTGSKKLKTRLAACDRALAEIPGQVDRARAEQDRARADRERLKSEIPALALAAAAVEGAQAAQVDAANEKSALLTALERASYDDQAAKRRKTAEAVEDATGALVARLEEFTALERDHRDGIRALGLGEGRPYAELLEAYLTHHLHRFTPQVLPPRGAPVPSLVAVDTHTRPLGDQDSARARSVEEGETRRAAIDENRRLDQERQNVTFRAREARARAGVPNNPPTGRAASHAIRRPHGGRGESKA